MNQKDYEQAIEHADNFLRTNPHGSGSAEALYLKGRALEEKFEQNGDPDPAELISRYARRSRFRGLIASGTQTTALLMGLIAATLF